MIQEGGKHRRSEVTGTPWAKWKLESQVVELLLQKHKGPWFNPSCRL